MVLRSAIEIVIISLLANVSPAPSFAAGDGVVTVFSSADSAMQSTDGENEVAPVSASVDSIVRPTDDENDTPSVMDPPPDSVSTDSSAALSTRSYLFLPDRYYNIGTTLTFSAQPRTISERILGFETYRASRRECTFQGAGMGMRLGMAAGAFGMMAGAWDEKETWYIAGAMTALGALYGGLFKADDPKFNLRVRVTPEQRR